MGAHILCTCGHQNVMPIFIVGFTYNDIHREYRHLDAHIHINIGIGVPIFATERDSCLGMCGAGLTRANNNKRCRVFLLAMAEGPAGKDSLL